MIDEKRIKRFIEGAKKAFKEVDDPTFTFPMNILSAYELATSIENLLKGQEQKTAYWIHCNGKSHIYYCSNCAEKVNYNNAHKVYNKNMKPIEQVNKFCRGCGYKMIPWPTDEQREAVKWDD